MPAKGKPKPKSAAAPASAVVARARRTANAAAAAVPSPSSSSVSDSSSSGGGDSGSSSDDDDDDAPSRPAPNAKPRAKAKAQAQAKAAQALAPKARPVSSGSGSSSSSSGSSDSDDDADADADDAAADAAAAPAAARAAAPNPKQARTKSAAINRNNGSGASSAVPTPEAIAAWHAAGGLERTNAKRRKLPHVLRLTVPDALSGTRLDVAITTLSVEPLGVPLPPDILAQRFQTAGAVRVNGMATRDAAVKVKARDVISVDIGLTPDDQMDVCVISARELARATRASDQALHTLVDAWEGVLATTQQPQTQQRTQKTKDAAKQKGSAAAAAAGGAEPVAGADGKLVLVPDPDALQRVRIVYADAHVIVVDKPPGMVVHPAPDSRSHVARGTLVHALLAFVAAERKANPSAPGLSSPADDPHGMRPGIVHRIDRDTTGLLVCARTNAAHAALKAQFAAHSCYRRYNCFVSGLVKADCGTVDTTIGRHPQDRKRRAVLSVNAVTAGPAAMTAHAQPPNVTAPAPASPAFAAAAAAAADDDDDDDGPSAAAGAGAGGAGGGAKRAVTHYFVADRFSAAPPLQSDAKANGSKGVSQSASAVAAFSLVECALETGRTHQVRVHMRHLTHPILSDPEYGAKTPKHAKGLMKRVLQTLAGSDDAKGDTAAVEAGGQLLHARRLGFVHPVTQQWMVFESPLPPLYVRLLDVLQPHALPRTAFQTQRAEADAKWLAHALAHTATATAAAQALPHPPAAAAAATGDGKRPTPPPAAANASPAVEVKAGDVPVAAAAAAAASAPVPAVAHKQSFVSYELESGRVLHIAELPASQEVGHKLWRATPLLGKYLERAKPPVAQAVTHRLPVSASAGDAKDAKAKPRARWLELGAGCGLLSLILADTGCRVVATDIGTGDVLKLMSANFLRNASDAVTAGALVARECTWQQTDVTPLMQLHGVTDRATGAVPAVPFDGVVAVDVTYHERLLQPLLCTIRSVSSSKTQIYVAGEVRCTLTHAKFVALAAEFGFAVTPLPARKLHKVLPPAYHDADVFVLQLKLLPTASAPAARPPAAGAAAAAAAAH